MRNTSRVALLSSFLVAGLLAFAGPVSAEVLTVKQGGGGDFTQIQAAVDYASDGDVILVYPGASYYGSFSVDGKALNIRGVDSLRVDTYGGHISNIPSGAYVGLEHLLLLGPLNSPGLSILNSEGSVSVHDCWIYGGWGSGMEGLRIQSSTDVKIVHCTIEGGPGDADDGPPIWNGGPGSRISDNSAVSMYDSTSMGGLEVTVLTALVTAMGGTVAMASL